jgi:hypothetical protein
MAYEFDVKHLEEDLEEISSREKSYAPWMAQVIINLPMDPGYKKLNPKVREEIEAIIAAVE